MLNMAIFLTKHIYIIYITLFNIMWTSDVRATGQLACIDNETRLASDGCKGSEGITFRNLEMLIFFKNGAVTLVG